MRALRVLSIVSLLVVGVVGSAMAQRVNTPGTYSAKVCVAPGFLPDGGASLPAELQNVGPDVYVGEIVVSGGGGGNYEVQFKGERSDGARLIVNATFDSDWAGFLLGSLIVGTSPESDCVTGIDVANLLDARINGIGTVDGSTQRVQAWIGPNGVVERYMIKKAPGPFRR